MTRHVRHVALTILGWVLLVAGIAALVLPGPGLLMIFAGMTILSQRYAWAEKRLRPIELKAMWGAAESVQTWPRIIGTCLMATGLVALGVYWFLQPDVPSWWPVHERWWLIGGRTPGATFAVSGLIAWSLVIWSYRRFHNKPHALARIEELARSN
ncbi:PGPGW domain-containing protein [Aestuariimicrobium ganziense]|uniref:PGPGW domain-containing protein n=1 Tax=Aestuariimicrobium ganziense TaxID=2773677 RepID=UPI0019436406|nr:PGPGW domain-containing protein [Aestuariimicrobium ganziense]